MRDHRETEREIDRVRVGFGFTLVGWLAGVRFSGGWSFGVLVGWLVGWLAGLAGCCNLVLGTIMAYSGGRFVVGHCTHCVSSFFFRIACFFVFMIVMDCNSTSLQWTVYLLPQYTSKQ